MGQFKMANWLLWAWQVGLIRPDPDQDWAPGKQVAAALVCGTSEGVHKIVWNDWIIKGTKDKLYPRKPDISKPRTRKLNEESTKNTKAN